VQQYVVALTALVWDGASHALFDAASDQNHHGAPVSGRQDWNWGVVMHVCVQR